MTARQSTEFELDAMTRTRLMLAGQIAAGLVSNPGHVACRDWENEAVRIAARMADKLVRLTAQGGF
jgi:hypothetical protein